MNDEERIVIIFRAEKNKEDFLEMKNLMKKESKNALILLKAYSQSKNPRAFRSKVINHSSLSPCLAVEFFMSLKEPDYLVKCCWREQDGGSLRFSLNYLETYRSVCRIYYLLNVRDFDDKFLEQVREILSSLLRRGFAEVYHKIQEIRKLIKQTITLLDEKRLLLVEKELGGEFFLEDIKKIEEKIGAYKLNPTLSKSLVKIKESNPGDENEYARDLGYIRAFFQEMIEDIANKISIKFDEDIQKEKNESKYVSCKRYLRRKEIIDEREEQIVNALWSFLSKAGSHRLASPKETYRLMFNMIIEMFLLLLYNSEIFLSDKK